ncbi:hypothetical protein D0Z07_6018, partial [Hyphodiscus hymeniophilus]
PEQYHHSFAFALNNIITVDGLLKSIILAAKKYALTSHLFPTPRSARLSTPSMSRLSWIAQIRNARNTAEQIAILRALKNELIGHPLKKETAVAQGILDPIVRLSSNTRCSKNDGKSHDHSFTTRPLNEEETISLASSVISRVCREERHQQSLASTGVLDALATKLASFVVAEGLVVPGAEIIAQKEALQEYIPEAAPPNASLAVILEAIAVIIADSKFRASQLLYSPSMLAIFPLSQPTDFVANQNTRAAWNAFNAAGLSARQSQLNAVDFLLPCVPHSQPRSAIAQASAFPPLGTSGSREALVQSGRKYNSGSVQSWTESSSLDIGKASNEIIGESEEPESPLVAFLIYILRSQREMERLMAASVLTVLYRAGLTNKTRETAIGLLVIPLLVHMLDDPIGPLKTKDNFTDAEATALDWAIKKRAPSVLAMLITDSEHLQKAAFEAGIIGKLSKMLKVSYDPVPETSNFHPWSPQDEDGKEAISTQSSLDAHGQSPLLAHKVEVRESALKAIAALVASKDEYRKAIVDQGMVPYIVESMNPNPRKPTPKSGDKSDKAINGSSEEESKKGYGSNPVTVLIAACGAIRALSRSVSILRTTLIDNGVVMPVFRLLQHPDLEVQIAATACTCNLVTDVSPMRDTIAEAGVLKVLCEHAHSMNAKLRLNALWGLKHFVYNVGNDMKRQCLDELGQGWLVQLICDDTEDEALLSSKGRSDKPSILEEMSEDVEMDQFEEQIDAALGLGRASVSRTSSSRSKSVQQAELRLAALRDAETNPARKARKDDIAVQEQGLDFIRNLIGGAGQGGTTETTEMIDFLFTALGQDRVFEILASKLRSKIINPFNRRSISTSETRVIPPQPEIITAVGFILVHMAASVPRHRQIVIAQTELLRLLVPQFNHPSIEVRLALCWLVTNLTWMDDTNDGQACAQRANELKKLGFLTKLEMLEQDPELNVRERAKSAIWQIKQTY